MRRLVAAGLACLALAGCATRPVNPPIADIAGDRGYRYQARIAADADPTTLLILAFSGGGTRAAAFAYGVLEELRDTEVQARRPRASGCSTRSTSSPACPAAASPRSPTACTASGCSTSYETAFPEARRPGRARCRASPRRGNWTALWSDGLGPLGDGGAALRRDPVRRRDVRRPRAAARTADHRHRRPTSPPGSRLGFTQTDFDLLCSDLYAVPLSRAAAASSAVPLVLSPVTLNNYGGTLRLPGALAGCPRSTTPATAARPAGRALQRWREMQEFQHSAKRPYIHLVDGGLSDNLGMRAVLEAIEQLEIAKSAGRATRFDRVRRIVFIVVNSLSLPKTDWDRRENPPNDVVILLKATGVPIDRYSYEAIELLRDTVLRWSAGRGAAGGGRRGRARHRPLRGRRVVRRAQRRDRAGVPQRPADVVRADRRGSRPPARGGQHHPAIEPRVPAPAWRPSHRCALTPCVAGSRPSPPLYWPDERPDRASRERRARAACRPPRKAARRVRARALPVDRGAPRPAAAAARARRPTHDDAIVAAIDADFGDRSQHETRLARALRRRRGVRDALGHLRQWMSARARVHAAAPAARARARSGGSRSASSASSARGTIRCSLRSRRRSARSPPATACCSSPRS